MPHNCQEDGISAGPGNWWHLISLDMGQGDYQAPLGEPSGVEVPGEERQTLILTFSVPWGTCGFHME